jgi:hypothetical protein
VVIGGWERTYCRPPTPDDLIVPTRNMTIRQSPESQQALLLDLQVLGLRARCGHDLRWTFVTLAQSDGAGRRILEAITHGPRGDIINLYRMCPWPVMCRELAKLDISLPPPSAPPMCDPTLEPSDQAQFSLQSRYSGRKRAESLAKRGDPSGIRRKTRPLERDGQVRRIGCFRGVS